MKWIGRLMGMGLMIWLVPDATSLGWYDKSGKLTISMVFLKTLVLTIVLPTFFGTLQRRSPHVE